MSNEKTLRNQMNINKLVNMYGVTVFYKMVVVVLGFVNSILINRCLGVELRGGYTTITNWASLMQLFFNLGIGTAYPAIKRRYPKQSKSIFSTIALLMSIIYAVIFCIVGLFLNVDARYSLIIAYVTTVENLIIFIALVENVKKRNKINIVTAIFHIFVLLLVYIFFKYNLYAVLWSVIIDHLVLGVSLVIINKIWDFNVKLLRKGILIELFKIAIPAMLMNMLMYLNYHADVLFLSGITKDNYVVGLYGTAVTLGNMLWIIPDAFKDIIYNRAAKKDNPKEIVVAIIANILICCVILIGFVILGKWFLRFMYGEDFVAAYPLVLLLFVGTFPMVLYKLIHPIYIANGKTGVVVALLSIAVITNLIGNIILIPILSGAGAAISSIVSYMICGVAFFLKFKHDYKVGIISTINGIKKIIKRK